ncbi:hypothetical protein CTEN210_17753 [Chaetoceros tenuissimus]|uniref:TLDc domain-containing protein n=1 Tax=Chaetoceros tenuissimus TaxID=426638 RepID=A0AAD3HET8_9STRA|nr:hypothetical protein CTEN210_17753 [Chaetoceros tenuissimus]
MKTDKSAPNVQSTGLEDFKQKIQDNIQKLTEKQGAIETRHQNILDRQAALANQNGGTDASPSDIIRLNICGTEMFARRDTLTAVKGSRLAALFSGCWENKLRCDEKNRVFMDLDPSAFRKVLDYLYTFKLDIDGKHTPDLPPDTNGLVEFFKLGDGAKKDTKVAASSQQTNQDEHGMLDEMMKNLDVLEKQLEDEESFVSYFTVSADEDINSDETKQSGVLDDVKSFSSDTVQDSFAIIEKGPVYNGIVTLFINGDILCYKKSTLCAEKDCKIAKDILNTDWINEHTIVTDQGRNCILMEYPREPLRELLAYFQSKMMLGKVSEKYFDLFWSEYSCSMMASIFQSDSAILKNIEEWGFNETTILNLHKRKTLRQWLDDTGRRTTKPTLLYRASRDGWSASDFHKYCVKRGNTVIVAKSLDGRKVFGGYTDLKWQNVDLCDYNCGYNCQCDGSYNHTSSTNSFLFVLTGNHIKMNIKTGRESKAIYTGSSSYGPVFGDSSDLPKARRLGEGWADLSIQGRKSTSNLGNTYDRPSDLSYSFLKCDLADYEVYQV